MANETLCKCSRYLAIGVCGRCLSRIMRTLLSSADVVVNHQAVLAGSLLNGGAQLHFDVRVLDRPCPNVNPITAQICQQLCDRILEERDGLSELPRQIRMACLNAPGEFPSAEKMAAHLGMSLRTLHRRLADDNYSYQSLLNDVRRSLDIEFMENTRLPIDQVAERIRFSDAASFRRSFRKWTEKSPSLYRNGIKDE